MPGSYPGYFFLSKAGEEAMNLEFYGLVKKLREYRLDQDVTLADIEKATGISQQRMKRIEQGISPITVEEVETLLNFYGMDAGALFSYNDLKRPINRQQKIAKAAIWVALVAVLGYGGYKGYTLLEGENAAASVRENTSVAEIMKQQPVGGEEKVSELLAVSQVNKPSTTPKKKPQGDVSTFHLAVYGDRMYHTGGAKPLTPVDFQLFPVSNFQVGQGVPKWIVDASKKSPTGIDIATIDVLSGQSREGVAKEIQSLTQHNIKVMGYGTQEQVFRPQVFEKNGVKYGIIAYTRVVPTVEWKAEGKQVGVADAYGEHIFKDIRRAKQQVDVLILTMYWGKEGQTAPESYQKEFAYDLLNAGADMIIGHRNPVQQPYEIYKGKYIFYNLGTAQLDVTFDKKSIKEIALVQGNNRRVLSQEKKTR
jgi:transcriptional regulator with XRE-family HTH domain